ncbi:uncharacterized protein LOC119568190 [Penaeus monodon]|uniref:uncharacterized protein LOC119568190 n=1 Tax=Penaeus monodon TaxID=6687 RepID=UPI0018A6F317|nr:uncharacterized protein LOC119568190 [Penaeus monodon]
MRGHVWIFITTVVLDTVVVRANIHDVLVNEVACRGGPAHFNRTTGTITSPLPPRAPPAHVNCSWILHNPYQDYIILSFSMFDLDQDNQCGKKSQDCCPHQWIMLKTEKHGVKKRRDIFSKVINGRRKNRESVEDSFKRSIQSHKLLKGHLFKDMDRMSRRRLINRQLSLRNKKRMNDTAASNQTSPQRLNQSRTSFKTSEILTTGHVCGNSTPWPIITRSPKVVVKFSSDLKVRRGHLGFKLQFFISNKTVCQKDEFQCSDPKICLPNAWKCNGQAECPDSSDEENCKAGCPGLREDQHCDGRWHCANGEDELGCFGCEADEWWCGEGKDCYKASRRCNGIADCRNKADEIYCSCLFNQTQCSPNSEFCYDPKTQRCDGILHCPGGEDEIGCGQCMQNISCGAEGGCYTPAQRCDGASQCGDSSDEASCTPQLCHPQHGAFLCTNRHCIREAWRCDQFDDCGDASDEEDCHRNSVIVAAAMGGLVCSLLLVIAVGCTCRLYALRVGLGRQHSYQGGRRSTQLAPLSRLEQHLLQREPPPSYSVAINDPSTSLWTLSRQWRRHRRCAPAPPDGLVPGMPVAVRGRLAPNPPCHRDAGSGQLPAPSQLSGTVGRRNSRSSDEKESEEEGKVNAGLSVPVERQVTLGDRNEEDVPLLSAIGDTDDEDITEREDVRLLDVSAESEESDGEAMESEESDNCSTDTSVVEAEVMSEGESESEAETGSAQSAQQEDACANKNFKEEEEEDDQLLEIENDAQPLSGSDSEDEDDGDVMMDTRAAVLALSLVQQHTNGISQVDTELISQ